MGQILYKDRYLGYMDIKTNYFNTTQIEADTANDIDLCLRNFAIAARSADYLRNVWIRKSRCEICRLRESTDCAWYIYAHWYS